MNSNSSMSEGEDGEEGKEGDITLRRRESDAAAAAIESQLQ